MGLGDHQLMNPSNNSGKFAIQQIVVHPNYTANDTVYDIALVKLNDTVDFTNYILPMCLPESSVEFPDNTSCWITGWGRTKSKGEESGKCVLCDTFSSFHIFHLWNLVCLKINLFAYDAKVT